ncbi:Protein of unknown function [Pyronema omphalodes CBS 100304]|uniref:Uncharacterized protein n=1 Tax=Pyronema omphalodes (strain CBS 100304) TaxID=1076935 RepID=U4LMM6_PYROM|nr:Protein of unknown function [Pyronema omphalodes CBS 100304]
MPFLEHSLQMSLRQKSSQMPQG